MSSVPVGTVKIFKRTDLKNSIFADLIICATHTPPFVYETCSHRQPNLVSPLTAYDFIKVTYDYLKTLPLLLNYVWTKL